MDDGRSPTSTVQPRLLHREIIALLVLSVAGILAYVVTRSLAESNAALRHADAVTWHEQGLRALERGDPAQALIALRRAAHIDRDNRDVSVALAVALRAAGEDEQAVAVLEALRSARPDDAEVNLQLARLEADHHTLPAAIRYYQDALDGLWAPGDAERSRTVRREFIMLLQQHGERARALSQALVYAAELPPEPEWQMQAAQLLLAVGDPRRALDRYTAVLKQQPRNLEALAGAGEAAFDLGEYRSAGRYLAQLPSPDERLASLRRVADFVLTLDPLAPRISRAERQRRLQQVLGHAADRLAACGGDDALTRELETFSASGGSAQSRSRATDAASGDRFEDGVVLAARVERAITSCGPADDQGRAISIVARERGLEDGR